MATSDRQFFKVFSGVLAVLVVISIIVAIIANISSSVLVKERSEVQIAKLKGRIQPVGRVNLASAPNPDVNQAQTVAIDTGSVQTSAASAMNGEEAYHSICQSCHDAGLLDSPKLGDAAAWKARLSVGKEALYNSAINGKGFMAPKGGNASLSDEEVRAAVDYMLTANQ